MIMLSDASIANGTFKVLESVNEGVISYVYGSAWYEHTHADYHRLYVFMFFIYLQYVWYFVFALSLNMREEQLMLADDICERSIWGSIVDMIEEAIADTRDCGANWCSLPLSLVTSVALHSYAYGLNYDRVYLTYPPSSYLVAN